MTETLERRRQEAPRPGSRPAAIARRARRVPALAALGVTAGLAGAVILAVRILGDVGGQPLFEDEAVAGLVSARPLAEVIHTVWWERGGAPLHFVLSHVALAPDGSPYALRWLSVVFAFATIPVAWDLGRRLGGHLAAGACALVVSASSMLWVYGSFGRMYSLYVFVAVLAVDLFVRAVRLRTRRAALVAALAAWLVPAVHPYGIFLVVAEALVGLRLWWGRPLRSAVPVALVALGLVPFLIADLRLADRFSVGLEGEGSIAPPGDAWAQVGRAFQATAGGTGWTLAVVAALALVGLAALLRRREHSVVALLVVAAALPPVLLFLARTSSSPGLSPRHLAYLVPLFAVLVGVGLARTVAGRGAPLQAAALAALAVVLLLGPLAGIRDPRGWSNDVLGGGPPGVAVGSPEQLAASRAWLEGRVDPGAVVFPYSAVYLAALPTTRHAEGLPYAQRETLLRALERVDPPVPEVFVSIPLGSSSLDSSRLTALLGDGFEFSRLGKWLLVHGEGPYRDDRELLFAIYTALSAARDSTGESRTSELGWYYTTTLWVTCSSLRTLGETCPPAPPDG